jgi:RNA polymerase sigma-70 factor (ECF subfamily)
MVRRIGDLRDPAAVRPWLRQVALNVARASGRRQQVRTPERRSLRLTTADLADSVPERSNEHPALADAAAEGARLLALARRLPEGYAEPLILRCVRGMSYREIGRVLDLPETTVETRIARARRMVRDLVAAASQPIQHQSKPSIQSQSATAASKEGESQVPTPKGDAP